MRPLTRSVAIAACLTVIATSAAQAETFFICWRGAGGYSMTGQMTVPDEALNRPIIFHDDVTEFQITGYFEGRTIGSWSLAELTPDTSWFLQYDVRGGFFPLKNLNGLYQMWNANGAVNNCGVPGFGFNAGNAGQDVCVDNTYIISSSIAWDTPILTYDAPQNPSCTGTELLGALPAPLDVVPVASRARGE